MVAHDPIVYLQGVGATAVTSEDVRRDVEAAVARATPEGEHAAVGLWAEVVSTHRWLVAEGGGRIDAVEEPPAAGPRVALPVLGSVYAARLVVTDTRLVIGRGTDSEPPAAIAVPLAAVHVAGFRRPVPGIGSPVLVLEIECAHRERLRIDRSLDGDSLGRLAAALGR